MINQSHEQMMLLKKQKLTLKKKKTEKDKFFVIEAFINANKSTTKHQARQKKFKNVNSLKYKPLATKSRTTEPTKQQNSIRQLYTNAVKESNITSRTYGNISRKSSNISISK